MEYNKKNIGLGALAVAGLLTAGMVLSTVYTVSQSQEGVIKRFGKYNRTEQAGLHFKLPFPIESKNKPEVTEIKRLEVGFRTIKQGPPATYDTHNEEANMLTGDENIVHSEFIVQYKIKNAKDYLFNVNDQKGTLRDAAEAAHRQVIGDNGIDEVLTTGKQEIQDKTKSKLQEIMDSYQSGIHIVAIQLQDVNPPEEVKAAFKDVASAKEDKSSIINVAKGYQNEVIPAARGEAEENIRAAQGDKAKRVNEAWGDVAKFNAILAEYRKAPSVTKTRLYIEAMEEVNPKLEYIIIDENQEGLLKFLDIDKNIGGGSK
ncbi:MAG: FtsH protease activity modulator HflK [archaeon]